MDLKTTSDILLLIKSAYPNFQILSGITAEGWNVILSNISPEAAMRATVGILRTPPEFPPTPGKIHEEALKIMKGPEELDMGPEEAFEFLRVGARKFGHYRRIEAKQALATHKNKKFRHLGRLFLDKVIDAEGEKERSFIFRDFKDAWESYDERQSKQKYDELMFDAKAFFKGIIQEPIKRIQ